MNIIINVLKNKNTVYNNMKKNQNVLLKLLIDFGGRDNLIRYIDTLVKDNNNITIKELTIEEEINILGIETVINKYNISEQSKVVIYNKDSGNVYINYNNKKYKISNTFVNNIKIIYMQHTTFNDIKKIVKIPSANYLATYRECRNVIKDMYNDINKHILIGIYNDIDMTLTADIINRYKLSEEYDSEDVE